MATVILSKAKNLCPVIPRLGGLGVGWLVRQKSTNGQPTPWP